MDKLRVFIYSSKFESIIVALINGIFLIGTLVLTFVSYHISNYLGYDIFDSKYLGYLGLIGMISFFFPFYTNGEINFETNLIKIKKKGIWRSVNTQFFIHDILKIKIITNAGDEKNYNSFGQIKFQIFSKIDGEDIFEFYIQRYLYKNIDVQMEKLVKILESRNINYETTDLPRSR